MSKLKNAIEKYHEMSNDIANMKEKSYSELYQVFTEQMKDKKSLIAQIAMQLEGSQELTYGMGDEWLRTWIRVDFSKLINTESEIEKEMLTQLFNEEYCMYTDF